MSVPYKKCLVEGCDRNATKKSYGCRGWCVRHYSRWRVYGDPTMGGTEAGAPQDWLRDVAIPYRGDDCLEWPFGKDQGGYGLVTIEKRQGRPHRWVCAQVHGEQPSDIHEVAHSCGNRACCNPAHLRWATRPENAADRLAHGTHNRGERHSMAKLSESDVLDIRERLAANESQKSIAILYGVSRHTIKRISARRIWGWLEEDAA